MSTFMLSFPQNNEIIIIIQTFLYKYGISIDN